MIFHFCLLEDRSRREAKVARYHALDPDAERVHRAYLWEEVVRERRVPLVPLPERYQQRFGCFG